MSVFAIAFPVGMFIAGIVAWRLSKQEAKKDREPPAWRDDSLDEWRKQRDLELEQERAIRSKPGARATDDTATARDAAETKKNQRIGG
ncbi:hypothetical protein AYO38_03690 [bacterium SCGC AG-212-C10]|nr:hypothetical protein AYO38_03690 [bacterium SCGC AG-212-C10]